MFDSGFAPSALSLRLNDIYTRALFQGGSTTRLTAHEDSVINPILELKVSRDNICAASKIFLVCFRTLFSNILSRILHIWYYSTHFKKLQLSSEGERYARNVSKHECFLDT